MVSCTVYILLWLCPITYVGMTKSSVPRLGNFLNDNYRVACLFSESVPVWIDIYYQVRHEGEIDWSSIHEPDFTAMPVFGYFHRFYLLTARSLNQPHGMLQRQRMAEFIKARYEKLHPDKPAVESVHFVAAYYLTGDDVIANPSGAWVKPPVEEVPHQYRRIISEHFFDGRIPRDKDGKEAWLKPRPK